VLRDVTAQRALERQLVQAQKMEAIGQLAGGVAHDFNNLVAIIQGYGTLLQHDLSPEDRHRADVDEIVGAARRAADLTRQLLSFSRRYVLRRGPVDLNQVIEGLEKMLERTIGRGVEFRFDLASDLDLVNADTSQLE